MTTLTPGANTSVSSGSQTVTISYAPVAGADLDVSAFLLAESGKVRGDNDMCFFGQHFAITDHRIERRSQFMAHLGQKSGFLLAGNLGTAH